MERQLSVQPPDKKKARVEEARAEEGDEIKNNGQLNPVPWSERSELEGKPQAFPPEERAEEHDEEEVTDISINNISDQPRMSEENSTTTSIEGPSEQDLQHLRRAQKEYRDMMRTREEVMRKKGHLDADIRYGPKMGTTDTEIQKMEAERMVLMERRTEIETTKGLIQCRLENIRGKITGTGTVSSKTDPVGWGTHTPVPTENEDEEDESEDEETSD